MPQAVETFLRSLTTSERARAAAFDAIYNVADDAQAEQALRQLPFSDEIKAQLWDARQGIDPKPLTPAVEPTAEHGAVSRFVGNAAERLNPITMVKGVAQAVAHPLQTVDALIDASAQQYGKAGQAFGEGRLSEAAGHALAGTIPAIGPMAAEIGEQAAAGDVAGAAGALTGVLTPMAAARPIANAARRAAPAVQAGAERRVVQALGPTKERFKAIAEKRAPEVLERGLGGSREALQAQAAQKAREAGQQIDALLEREGGRAINLRPVIDALEQAKSSFQTTRSVPLADAIKDGLERTPGARVVGNAVEIPVVFEPRAVAQLSRLQRVMEDLGPEARVDQVVAIRRAWDKVVSDAGGFQHRRPSALGQPLKDISEAATKRQATTAIRQLLDSEVPDLSVINREFAFWKDVDSVLRQTIQRTQPQGPGLLGRVREGAGQVAGAVIGGTAAGPLGAGAGAIVTGQLAKAAHAVFTSPRWRLVSARTRHQLADALASGNPERISTALGRASSATGGGTAVSPVMAAERREETPRTRAQR